jgi:hypothetical protein
MFRTAVVGPVVSASFGVARECIECGGADSAGEACGGFGPGCLGLKRRGPEVQTAPDERGVHLSFRNGKKQAAALSRS